jgi:predicted phosphodiesterase
VRFQVASDLHLEMLYRFAGYRVIEPAPEADALILAGDVHSNTHAIGLFADWPVSVYYVHGNHELYGANYYGLISQLHRTAAQSPIHYLERSVVQLAGIRILGCCLWTDYALGGDPVQAMDEAELRMRDHHVIRVSGGGHFLPIHALYEHEKSRAWLQVELSKQFDGKTVVITHHGPHPNSVHPRYAGDPLNAAFVSDLTPLVEHADFWIHGHVHDFFDYTVGKCRVIANPRGYARNRFYAEVPEQIVWENPAFDPALVIEV